MGPTIEELKEVAESASKEYAVAYDTYEMALNYWAKAGSVERAAWAAYYDKVERDGQ